jgi:hypothetical protein
MSKVGKGEEVIIVTGWKRFMVYIQVLSEKLPEVAEGNENLCDFRC